MITIRDLAPDALRFEDLTAAEVADLLAATADIIPLDGPGSPVPAQDPNSPVRTAGRVTWGPSFVLFSAVTAEEATRVSDAFRKLHRLAELTSRGANPPPE